MRVLLAASGSVAALKVPQLADFLVRADHEVQIIVTESADKFLECEAKVPLNVRVWRDADEWTTWQKRGDPVLHIELRKWADVLVLAPLSANTLAKITIGLCDNLLTNVARAWDYNHCWLVLAPAMNTYMWESDITRAQMQQVSSRHNVRVVPPVSKTLICGDIGVGAMADVQEIVACVNGLNHTA
ncbi:Phosphopantothenoylcysteine decarboxylase [Porphyridium purpureum]|uniref:Phosphopantothenoylcysteine decarboxylase n=1 Tax=Porphyridium purpureum TaxID=35688 RepID=A0A5J4YJB7_PORPP|nr:Phosphopantothenoylcysteine decarboxylase [Porphyridium purpureum]|eukprot:POR5995..scf210_14